MKLHYNAPVVLTLTLLSILVLSLNPLTQGQLIPAFFTVYPDASWASATTWVQVVGHVMGHLDWDHALANFAIILLIGPMLEEKYGSGRLLLMLLFTALITGVMVNLFFDAALLGASGVAFMMILLASFANAKTGHIPLTFVLVTAIYLGREFVTAFEQDHISQLAHIIGGVMGSIFGFSLKGVTNKATGKAPTDPALAHSNELNRSIPNISTQNTPLRASQKTSYNAAKDDLLSNTPPTSGGQKVGSKEPFDPYKPLKLS
jgi:membrane associated rhomboid family serine protease